CKVSANGIGGKDLLRQKCKEHTCLAVRRDRVGRQEASQRIGCGLSGRWIERCKIPREDAINEVRSDVDSHQEVLLWPQINSRGELARSCRWNDDLASDHNGPEAQRAKVHVRRIQRIADADTLSGCGRR